MSKSTLDDEWVRETLKTAEAEWHKRGPEPALEWALQTIGVLGALLLAERKANLGASPATAEPQCPTCHRQWDADPGTVYCASQHGLCGICRKPRTLGTCKCLTSGISGASPATGGNGGESA